MGAHQQLTDSAFMLMR